MPLRSASPNTTITGRIRKTARNASASAISSARTAVLSVVTAGARRTRPARSGVTRSDMTEPPPAPRLDEVDREQDDEGERQHDHRDRGSAAIVELLELDHDQDRRDLRDIRQVAG